MSYPMIGHRGSVASEFEEIGVVDTLGSWRWRNSNEVLPSRNGICEVVDQGTYATSSTTNRRDSRDARPNIFRPFRPKDSTKLDPQNHRSTSSSTAAVGGSTPMGQFAKSQVEHSKPNNDLNDADETDSHDKVKTKLLSVWNNMKYGWTVRLKTNFSRDAPIWLLGHCYHKKLADETSGKDGTGQANGIEGFKQDFVSRIWFTYRREFPTLSGSSYTTDCGWGCMLRSGQMLLAQGLLCHLLGRSWRWQTETAQQQSIHRQIIRYFGDNPSSLFSLHKLVAIGESSGKKAGDWYGPASVAHILKQCMESSAAQKDSLLKDVCIYVAQDCTVYKQEVLKLCDELERKCTDGTGSNFGASSSSSACHWQKGIIILVPVRLGGEVLNPIYFKCVQAILSNENCIGIIGGRPKHSLYFVGWQEDKLIHLDPHYCQEAIEVRSADFPLQSFHCHSPRKLSFSRMDPSCTIGFYCQSKAEVLTFLASCNEVLTPPHPQADYPIFVVAENNDDLDQCELEQNLKYDSIYPHLDMDEYGPISDDEDLSEFVFL